MVTEIARCALRELQHLAVLQTIMTTFQIAILVKQDMDMLALRTTIARFVPLARLGMA
jgi:hypothetical protein